MECEHSCLVEISNCVTITYIKSHFIKFFDGLHHIQKVLISYSYLVACNM